eukprot:922562_1
MSMMLRTVRSKLQCDFIRTNAFAKRSPQGGAVFHLSRILRLSSSSSSSSSLSDLPPPDAAQIIQGPSLLANTNVHRPSPSMFFLPGLRSLPFWTSPPTAEDDPSKVSIAYGDPAVTSIVKHLEA